MKNLYAMGNSNKSRISYCFRDTAAESSRIIVFTPFLVLRQSRLMFPLRVIPCDLAYEILSKTLQSLGHPKFKNTLASIWYSLACNRRMDGRTDSASKNA